MIEADFDLKIQVEEFPEDSPSNLDSADQAHWARIRQGKHFFVSPKNKLSAP